MTGDDLAHYSKSTVDIMYKFPHGLEELEGIANRTDFDLGSHSKKQKELNIKSNVAANKDSNSKLAVQDEEGNWVVPFVIEPSAGVERGFLAILNEAYNVENLDDQEFDFYNDITGKIIFCHKDYIFCGYSAPTHKKKQKMASSLGMHNKNSC